MDEEDRQTVKDALFILDALKRVTTKVAFNVSEIASNKGVLVNTVETRFGTIRKRQGLKIGTYKKNPLTSQLKVIECPGEGLARPRPTPESSNKERQACECDLNDVCLFEDGTSLHRKLPDEVRDLHFSIEDASDSDVSTDNPDPRNPGIDPKVYLTTPVQPPPANPETKEAIEARLTELGNIEKENAYRFELLSSKRQRKDDQKRNMRAMEEHRIQAARANKDERVRLKRALQDNAFAQVDQAIDAEEFALRHKLKRLKKRRLLEVAGQAYSSASMSPVPSNYQSPAPPAKRHQPSPPTHIAIQRPPQNGQSTYPPYQLYKPGEPPQPGSRGYGPLPSAQSQPQYPASSNGPSSTTSRKFPSSTTQQSHLPLQHSPNAQPPQRSGPAHTSPPHNADSNHNILPQPSSFSFTPINPLAAASPRRNQAFPGSGSLSTNLAFHSVSQDSNTLITAAGMDGLTIGNEGEALASEDNIFDEGQEPPEASKVPVKPTKKRGRRLTNDQGPKRASFKTSKRGNPMRKGPLPPDRREQVAKVRGLGACLRCKFLKKTCDEGEPCAECQPSRPRLWRVPCTRIDIKEIGSFTKDFNADYDRHVTLGLSTDNIKGFSDSERTLWITHGYGEIMLVKAREVYVRNDKCFTIDWTETTNWKPTEFKVTTARLSARREDISTSLLSDYLDRHIDSPGSYERFVDDYFDGSPFLSQMLKTAYRHWLRTKLPVIRVALKLMLAYKLTLHVTMVEGVPDEEGLTGRIEEEASRFYGKTMAPAMINFQIKQAMADMWRELQKDVLEDLSSLYSSVHSDDRLKNWPTIFILSTILLAVWECIQFDCHYCVPDTSAVDKFCSDMETTPVGVIVGLFQAISQKWPSFMEWDTSKHHQLLASNRDVCTTMTEIRDHVTQYEPYLRTRTNAKFDRMDFHSLSNKFLSKLVIRA